MIIDISPDHVIMEDVRVERPARISRLHWVEFWERSRMTDRDYEAGYDAGYKDAERDFGDGD